MIGVCCEVLFVAGVIARSSGDRIPPCPMISLRRDIIAGDNGGGIEGVELVEKSM
jgi:hypothetical protein